MSVLEILGKINFKEKWAEWGITEAERWLKYRSRPRIGDIVKIFKPGRITEAIAEDQPYVFLINTGIGYNNAIKKAKPWKREVTYTILKNDTTNGIYEYRITLGITSKDGREMFNLAMEKFRKLPRDIEIIDKSSSHFDLRLTTGDIQRRNDIYDAAKNELHELAYPINNFRYRIDLKTLPEDVKESLKNERVADIADLGYNKTDVLGWIVDKSRE